MEIRTLGMIGAIVFWSAACGQSAIAAAAHTDRALKSCHSPDFDPESGKTFIRFNSSSYSAVSKKIEQIDPENAENLTVLLMAGKFTALGGIDLFIPLLTLPCTYETYEADQCQMMSLMLGNNATLEDVTLEVRKLSYTIRKPNKNEVYKVGFGDRDFNSMKLTTQEAEATTESEWTRDLDGTEHHVAKASDGSSITYIERPDCSGKAEMVDAENGTVTKKTNFEWTSTKIDAFEVKYTVCKYRDGEECQSGSF